ncbi:TPA: fibronectin type III domain-containing protein, partial [Pseudomonas aeruginosa]|nr:fibronectin type III domain-containing protein [Pseudomonas aeruginosa]
SRDFVRIPAQRLAIGLPSNVDAAATGYVIDPAAVSNAFRRLEAAGHAIKGLMTWSVNWDDGLNKRGERYNWEFRKRYASLIHDGEGGDQRPAAPQGLRLLERGETSLVLAWNASSGQRPIDYYSLYRDGAMVGQSAALGSTDSGLTADTRYSYFVTATDTQGNQSLPSEGLEVSTSGGAVDPQFPQWRENQAYRVDDGVTYEGLRYLCLQAHTSNSGWTPPVAFTLWRPLR